jgi:Sec-independent protein translocase protein TatA
MRELIFIFAVALVLLGLTAFKYRRQIKAFLGVAKMLRESQKGIKEQMASQKRVREPKEAAVLVPCSKCGVHVPKDRAISRKNEVLCSRCS